MNPDLTPYSLKMIAELVEGLSAAAAETARATARRGRRLLPRTQRGRTLRPGPATPLWNELVKHTLPLLNEHGSKAQLARVLGLPRQRLYDCLKAKTACLDAERTLLLLCWVAARKQGRDLAAAPGGSGAR